MELIEAFLCVQVGVAPAGARLDVPGRRAYMLGEKLDLDFAEYDLDPKPTIPAQTSWVRLVEHD